MTTTVTVKTRGHGASVSVAGQSVFVGPNRQCSFDTNDTMSLSLRQETPDEARTREENEAAEAVPGSVENDRLVREVDPEKLAKLSGADNTTAPKGNRTGATEIASTTNPKRA